jgi:hypothetical protein
MLRTFVFSLVLLFSADAATAATCLNRFVNRSQRNSQQVTLLTGRLTFQEAQALAESISRGESPKLEWVNESGKTIARQVGELKVVRPMPVGCDGKKSGVVMIATFFALHPPENTMAVKLDAQTTVTFEEQEN